MTTEEAIKALKWKVVYAKDIGESYTDCVNIEALDTIIKALEGRPQGDLISRELLKKDIDAQISDFNELNKKGEPYKEFKDIRAILFGLFIGKNLIDNAPPVDAIVNTIEVRPQGKWIDHTATQNLLWGHLECPFCHKRSNRGASYCQYCGARLEEAEENA